MVTTRKPAGSFWPTALQEKLLVAALGDVPEAVSAWQAAQPEFDLEVLEPGSFQLMPLIYRNLVEARIEDDHLSRLKGIYRREWVRNNIMLERTRESALALERAGIPALFVEGVALAHRFYPELGYRPTGFIDVLVDERSAADAIAALGEAGWAAGRPDDVGPGGLRHLRDTERAITCVLRTALAFDFAFPGDRERSDAPLWDAAEAHDLDGVAVRVPSPTDTLLAVCVTGPRRQDLPTIQWLVDASMVLRASPVDWDRIVEIAGPRGQARRIADAFEYLAGLPGPHPPTDPIRRLRDVPEPLRSRIAYRCSAGSVPHLGALPDIVAEHLVATAGQPPLKVVTAFPRELRDRWGLGSVGELPAAAFRRARRLLSRRGG